MTGSRIMEMDRAARRGKRRRGPRTVSDPDSGWQRQRVAPGLARKTIRMQLGQVGVLHKPVPYPDLLAFLWRARGEQSTAA